MSNSKLILWCLCAISLGTGGAFAVRALSRGANSEAVSATNGGVNDVVERDGEGAPVEPAPGGAANPAIEPAVAALKLSLDTSSGVSAAVRAAGIEDADAAVPLLERAFEDPKFEAARGEVLRSLRLISSLKSARALVQIATLHEEWAQQAATRLSQFDRRESEQAMLDALAATKREGPIAAAAVRSLGAMRLRQHLGLHTELAHGTDAAVRVAAVEAIGEIADPLAIDTLDKLARDPISRVRRRAVEALGKIRAPRAATVLKALLEVTESSGEREKILDAIARQEGTPRGPFR